MLSSRGPTLSGGPRIARSGRGPYRAREALMSARRRIRLLIPIVGLALGAVVGVVMPRVAHELPESAAVAARLPERLWTRFLPPLVSRKKRLAALMKPEREAVSVLGRRLDGLLVWSSNRSGNHELYLVDLREQSVRQLTHDPHVDFFSRFSPDGRRVLFLRSQREWVSFREDGAWDVMLVNVDGTGEERLVRGGYHPTWADRGAAVLFARGKQLWQIDLATRQQRLVLD